LPARRTRQRRARRRPRLNDDDVWNTHALNPEKSQKEERWSFQEIISFFFLFCSFWFFTDERITRQRTDDDDDDDAQTQQPSLNFRE
jgi:hypothetical protein